MFIPTVSTPRHLVARITVIYIVYITMDVASNAAHEPSHLCSVCLESIYEIPERGVLRTVEEHIQAKDQTLETFREAARQQCFICSTIWNLSEKHRLAWSSLQESSWKPMTYMVLPQIGDPDTWLTVSYSDPLHNDLSIYFRLISTQGTLIPYPT